MELGVILFTVLIAVMTALSGCSFGVREDVDQIGSSRSTYTLGWKEGPREEPYRPYRQQQNYYYPQPQQGAGAGPCEPPMAPASPVERPFDPISGS